MLEIKEDYEIIALVKVLGFIKFHFDDYNMVEFAASPFIGEIYKKACDASAEVYKKFNTPYPTEWDGIDNKKSYLKAVLIHISNIGDWMTLSDDVKIETIKVLAYPYTIKEETIQDLISKGDKLHLNIKVKILKYLFYVKGVPQEDITYQVNSANKVPYTDNDIEKLLNELAEEKKIYLRDGLWYLDETFVLRDNFIE